MKGQKTYRFIISGGGTGGHIYPAIAVAQEIKSRFPEAEILFVGASGRMEMKKVPEAGFSIKGLWISGLQRSMTFENILFPIKLLVSYFKALSIVNSFKPDAVIGFGGYASGPIMMAANAKDVPTIIQEQNSYAGLANRKLSKKARRICVAYKDMEKYFPADKLKFTGNPVRKDILNIATKRDEAMTKFELDPQKSTILVIGGSLGARTINMSIAENLPKISDSNVQVLWQAGSYYYLEMKKLVEKHGCADIKLHEFISEMDMAYAAADIVISRAGALSISELCLVGKPVILVPSPNVAEDHQAKNAKSLSEEGAAILVKDNQANEKLIDRAIELLGNKEEMSRLATNIKKMSKPQAAAEIVDEILKVVS